MDKASIESAIADMTPEEKVAFMQRLMKCSDPKRHQALYLPFLEELHQVISKHVVMSLAKGGMKDMLIPPDITQVLVLLLSAHVAETSDAKLEPGAVSLSVSQLVAELVFKQLEEKRKKKGGGRG